MNEDELEKFRNKMLLKFWLLIIIPTVLITISVYTFFSNIIFTVGQFGMFVIWLILVISIILYKKAGTTLKKYENTVKKYLIKNALKSFRGAKINWEAADFDGTYSTEWDENSTINKSRANIILNARFDIEREDYNNKLSVIRNKCSECFEKQVAINSKDEITEEEKKIFNDLREQFIEMKKEEKAIMSEQYKKDCEELKNLELNSSGNQNFLDKYKIEYLKEKIQEYDEKAKIEKILEEVIDLEEKEEAGTLTTAEKERLEFLHKQEEERNREFEEEYQKENRYSMVYNVFGSYINEDDTFWGTYKDIPFTFVEAHDYSSKYHSSVFSGTILRIRLKDDYNNKILALKKMTFCSGTWYNSIKNGLTELKINLPFFAEYEIYVRNKENIDSIINNNFVDFVNKIQDYSYIIEEDNLYVIIPHSGDKFKFGNLFKKIDDETQYEKFYDDINKILNIIEAAGKHGICN